MSLFQSNLRKQIRKLPKILKSVKIIQYYSILFMRVLNHAEHEGADEAVPRLRDQLHQKRELASKNIEERVEHALDDVEAAQRCPGGGVNEESVEPEPMRLLTSFQLLANFEKLVLGCIDADFCK